MARLPDEEIVDRLVGECVRRGLTVPEIGGAQGAAYRSQVEAAVGLGAVSEWLWRAHVQPRLLSAMARAARGSSGSRGRVPRCRSCDQPIRWVTTEAGKRLALDPLPHPMGNVARARGTRRDVWRVHPTRDLPLPAAASAAAWRAHWATCPNSEAHRSKVTRLVRSCRLCGLEMHPGLVSLGYRTHPNCDPDERVEEPTEGRWSE